MLFFCAASFFLYFGDLLTCTPFWEKHGSCFPKICSRFFKTPVFTSHHTLCTFSCAHPSSLRVEVTSFFLARLRTTDLCKNIVAALLLKRLDKEKGREPDWSDKYQYCFFGSNRSVQCTDPSRGEMEKHQSPLILRHIYVKKKERQDPKWLYIKDIRIYRT